MFDGINLRFIPLWPSEASIDDLVQDYSNSTANALEFL